MSNSKPNEERAVTPKQGNKLYASTSLNKDQMRMSGKINHSTLNINRMAPSNDYLLKTSMSKLQGSTQQMSGLSSMLSQSSKLIPKKDNFNTTQGVKTSSILGQAAKFEKGSLLAFKGLEGRYKKK